MTASARVANAEMDESIKSAPAPAQAKQFCGKGVVLHLVGSAFGQTAPVFAMYVRIALQVGLKDSGKVIAHINPLG